MKDTDLGECMSELIIATVECDRCGLASPETDNFCRNCGFPNAVPSDSIVDAQIVNVRPEVTVVAAHSTMVMREPSVLETVLKNRVYVIAILLCAGPIGLPALWFSNRFSRRCKVVTTAAYFLLTAAAPLAITWYFLDIAVKPVVDALSQ